MSPKTVIQSIQLSRKVRREHKAIARASERVLRDQKIRYETIRELSALGMLKNGVN